MNDELMNDELMQMAEEAFATPGTVPAFDNGFFTVTPEELERFATLVAKKAVEAEREAIEEMVAQAITQTAETIERIKDENETELTELLLIAHGAKLQGEKIADAIHARGVRCAFGDADSANSIIEKHGETK